MNDAAKPIRATDSARPMTRTQVCSRAAPATASTLSSDMETSARTIWVTACLKVLGGALAVSWPSRAALPSARSEEHTSELQSLMRTTYAVICLKKKLHEINNQKTYKHYYLIHYKYSAHT